MSIYWMYTRKLGWAAPILGASVIFLLLTQLLAKPLPKLPPVAPFAANTEEESAFSKLKQEAQTLIDQQSEPIAPAAFIDTTNADNSFDTAAVLVQVNSRSFAIDEWQRIQSADQAMNQLLAISNDSELMVTFDRVVNQELAWQAASTVGFTVEESEIQQILQQLLASHSRSEFDLENALIAQQVDRSFFITYLRRLITADRFVGQEVAEGAKSAEDVLQQLRAQAHISFGPAFSSLLQITQTVEATVVPIQPAQPFVPLVLPKTPRTNVDKLFPALAIKPLVVETIDQTIDPSSKPALQEAATVVTETISNLPTSAVTAIHPPTSSEMAPIRGTNAGELPPQLELPRLGDGEKVSLDDFVGKAIVLSFWVTWCPYCQQQTPVLIEGATRYANANVQFIGVNVKEEPATVQYFADQQPFGYPILLDPEGASATQFHVSGFPVTYFLDHNGLIAANHVGALSAELLDSYLEPLLNGSD